MNCLKVWVFILAWAGALAPMVSPAPLHAQSNPPFQNPSLDSNCYFPQIGVAGEIDTIYGDSSYESLGAYIHNLGPKPDGTPSNMLIGQISLNTANPIFISQQDPTGPNFNLHNLHAIAQNLHAEPSVLRFGHFHDQAHVDIFDGLKWIIYWADDNGNYDTSRKTRLVPSIYGSYGTVLNSAFTEAYITHLTNDTLDDIVVSYNPSDSIRTKDSLYIVLFKGVNQYNRSISYDDTSITMPPPYINDYHLIVQGGFRGTGRDDLLISDNNNNLFFYKNDPPFSLDTLLNAMLYDTLCIKPSRLDTISNLVWQATSLIMHALPKKRGDNSYDWVVEIPTFDSGNAIYIFRGGPAFGSHRITIDSAVYAILPPTTLGESNWPDFFRDAGDMTGTGNHVLYVAADDGAVAYQNFYVMGQALDNKIDIYNTFAAGAGGDTLTANPDSLEDLLFGLYYTSPSDLANGLREVGSMWLMYGSKNIPVHLNPQFADVVNIPQQNGAGITFSPNPVTQSWSEATIVWPESEDGQYSIYDMLGRKLEHGPIRLFAGAEQQRIYFRGIPQGVYIYTIEGAHGSVSAKIVKLGGASGSSGTSQPSIIQQMKDTRDGKVAQFPEAPPIMR